MPISDEHPDDLLLDQFADDPASVPPEVAAHISQCAKCRGKVAFDQKLRELGPERSSRSGTMSREARSAIQFRRQTEIEDVEANRLLDDVINNPYAFVLVRIVRRKQFQTGGVVRKLSGAARTWVDKDPLFAFQLAKAATIIADALLDGYYPSGAVNDIRGLAWKERGNVCWYLGRYADGLQAADNADAAYKSSNNPGDGLASVKALRATILWRQKNYVEALRFITAAAADYLRLRMTQRYIEAKETEAAILHRMGRIDVARLAYQKTYEMAESINDTAMKARAAKNLSVTAREAGDLGSASHYALIALRLFEELDYTLTVIRTRFLIAQISLTAGHFREASRSFRQIASEFETAGAFDEAADVKLDLSEALLMLGELEEVEAVCTELVMFYRQQNIITNALTAVSFLKEAAAHRSISRQHIVHVRRYLADRKDDPELMFAPPHPSSPDEPC